MAPRKQSHPSDSEWDEDASRAQWEAQGEHNGVTWEEVRGFRRGFEIGNQWEVDVVRFLRSAGFADARQWDGDSRKWSDVVERVYGSEFLLPPPDILGIEGWTLELKNRSDAQFVKLGNYLNQAEDERRVTGDAHAALISKRRGSPIEDAYVIMRLEDWTRLVARLREDELPPTAPQLGSRDT